MDESTMRSLQNLVTQMQVVRNKGAERVPVFVVGSFARRVTFYSQQVRGFNLAHALNALKIVSHRSKVAVIGAGAAGLAASVGLLKSGVSVTLIDRHTLPFSRQMACNHRWLHPHIYDWPNEVAKDVRADLPVLSWTAGRADDVIKDLRQKWDAFSVQGEIKELLDNKLGWNVDGFHFNQGKLPITVSTVKDDFSASDDFAAAIIAVGFGEDDKTFPQGESKSYWDDDGIDRAKYDHPTVFISGDGDGALIDVIRCCTKGIQQGDLISTFGLDDTEMDDIRNRLLIIERNQELFPNAQRLMEDYTQILSDIPKRLRDKADELVKRRDVNVVFHTKHKYWLSRRASILNRFLTLLLTTAARVKMRVGELSPESISKRPDGNYEIPVQGYRPVSASFVLLRHGAKSEFDESGVLGSAVGDSRDRFRNFAELDTTTVPLWSGGMGVQHQASRSQDPPGESEDQSHRESPPPPSPQDSDSNAVAGITADSNTASPPLLYVPNWSESCTHWGHLTFEDIQRVNLEAFALLNCNERNQPPAIVWHPQIRGALLEVEAMYQNVDQRQSLYFKKREGREVDPSSVGWLRNGFFDRRTKLRSVLRTFDTSYRQMFDAVRLEAPQYLEAAVTTVASMASLYIVMLLSRMRLYLIDAEGRAILRMFANAGWRDAPVYVFDKSDEFAMTAFPYMKGLIPEFLECRIGPNDNQYEYIVFPRTLAESLFENGWVNEHTYYTWVLPQWVLRHDQVPPSSKLAMLMLKDRGSREWQSYYQPSPWKNEASTSPDGDDLKLGGNSDNPRNAIVQVAVSVPATHGAGAGSWSYWASEWNQE